MNKNTTKQIGRPKSMQVSTRFSLCLPVQLIERIKSVSGLAPLSAWIREAINEKIKRDTRDCDPNKIVIVKY
jgi:hypothetical protein